MACGCHDDTLVHLGYACIKSLSHDVQGHFRVLNVYTEDLENIQYHALLITEYTLPECSVICITFSSLTHSCQKISLTNVVWTFGTFEYNFGINYIFIKYLKENCGLGSDGHYFFSCVGPVVKRWSCGADEPGSIPGGSAEKGNFFPCCLLVL